MMKAISTQNMPRAPKRGREREEATSESEEDETPIKRRHHPTCHEEDAVVEVDVEAPETISTETKTVLGVLEGGDPNASLADAPGGAETHPSVLSGRQDPPGHAGARDASSWM